MEIELAFFFAVDTGEAICCKWLWQCVWAGGVTDRDALEMNDSLSVKVIGKSRS